MAINSVFRVTYHFEKNGKRCSDTAQDNVLAAASDYTTISGILIADGRTNNGVGTLVIESIGHASGLPALGVLS